MWNSLNLIRALIREAFPTKKQPQPTIDSYGQNSCGLPEDQIQSIMEWLFLSLISAGYWGNAPLLWYNEAEDPDLEQALKEEPPETDEEWDEFLEAWADVAADNRPIQTVDPDLPVLLVKWRSPLFRPHSSPATTFARDLHEPSAHEPCDENGFSRQV